MRATASQASKYLRFSSPSHLQAWPSYPSFAQGRGCYGCSMEPIDCIWSRKHTKPDKSLFFVRVNPTQSPVLEGDGLSNAHLFNTPFKATTEVPSALTSFMPNSNGLHPSSDGLQPTSGNCGKSTTTAVQTEDRR